MFCTPFLLADMSSTAFIEPLPVIEFVAQLLCRDISVRPLSDSDRVKVRFTTCPLLFTETSVYAELPLLIFLPQIKKALRGIKVEVTHRGNMRRKYRISGLTSQATRELSYVLLPVLYTHKTLPLLQICS